MTIIEFLDREPIENMVSMLTNHPEKVIYVGAANNWEKQKAGIFASAGRISPDTGIEFVPVTTTKLDAIVKALSKIVQEYPGCSFDLTGGDDLSMVAMGIVFERYRSLGLQMHQYNIRTGRVYDCDGDRETVSGEIPPITVEDVIAMHGGCIVTAEQKENGTREWDWNEDFRRDVEAMWKINIRDCGQWNAQVSSLADMLELMKKEEDPLLVDVSVSAVRRRQEKGDHYLNLKGIFPRLQAAGLLTELKEEDDRFRFRFKNLQVKQALEKAGTILELKTALIAKEMKRGEENVFADVRTGVFIDWDGEVHGTGEYIRDTENEIDVVMTDHLIPVFISCKNGSVGDEELYKLDNVATRFGGKHVRRILAATTFGKSASSLDSFLTRAEAMNIRVIKDVHLMSDEEFAEAIWEAMKAADQSSSSNIR